MAKGFSLSVYPFTYLAKYQTVGGWTEEYVEQSHRTPEEEQAMDPADLEALLLSLLHIQS